MVTIALCKKDTQPSQTCPEGYTFPTTVLYRDISLYFESFYQTGLEVQNLTFLENLTRAPRGRNQKANMITCMKRTPIQQGPLKDRRFLMRTTRYKVYRSTVPCTGDKEYRKIRLLGGYFSAIKIVIIRSVCVRSFCLFIPFCPPNDDIQLHSTSHLVN